MTKRILVVEDQPDNRQIIRDMLAPTDYEITEGRRRKSAGGNRKGAARSHLNQGRSCIAINPDNCGYVLCAQWRRTEGADGRLR
jgi:response regulator RpfG family c-di-GMP phosphodiesterase